MSASDVPTGGVRLLRRLCFGVCAAGKRTACSRVLLHRRRDSAWGIYRRLMLGAVPRRNRPRGPKRTYHLYIIIIIIKQRLPPTLHARVGLAQARPNNIWHYALLHPEFYRMRSPRDSQLIRVGTELRLMATTAVNSFVPLFSIVAALLSSSFNVIGAE